MKTIKYLKKKIIKNKRFRYLFHLFVEILILIIAVFIHIGIPGLIIFALIGK